MTYVLLDWTEREEERDGPNILGFSSVIQPVGFYNAAQGGWFNVIDRRRPSRNTRFIGL